MLSHKRKYLQVALNGSLFDAETIIATLPVSERIIVEAGTPLIKEYGSDGIRTIFDAWQNRIRFENASCTPYVVADMKCMDRGKTEVEIAKDAGASAVTVLGIAPIETINVFIQTCNEYGIDSMIDMMNVDQPFKVLRKLRKMPSVVVLHRGVDEETFNKDKPLPYIQINKIKGSFNTMLAMAGGDSIREVQREIFNGIDIVVVWKDFYNASSDTKTLAQQFLKEIK